MGRPELASLLRRVPGANKQGAWPGMLKCRTSADEGAFLLRIARALGVASGLQSKVCELRSRIEDVLQAGDLMLVMDEAHYLWPAGRHCAARARAHKLDQYRAGQIRVPRGADHDTPSFTNTAQIRLEKATGWNADQFYRADRPC